MAIQLAMGAYKLGTTTQAETVAGAEQALTAQATRDIAEVQERIRQQQLGEALFNLRDQERMAVREAAIATSSARAMRVLQGGTGSGTAQAISAIGSDLARTRASISASITGTETMFEEQQNIADIQSGLAQDITEIEEPGLFESAFEGIESTLGIEDVEGEDNSIVGGILAGAAAGSVFGPVGAFAGGFIGGLWDFFD